MKILLIILLVTIIIFFAYRKGLQEGLTNNPNIILIGDSVLNNSNYVDKSVADVLKTKTPNVYNYATDGATIADCYKQLDKVSIELNKSNTYVFISAGGNNILNVRGQLSSDAIRKLFDTYLQFIESVKAKLPNVKINLVNLYLPSNPRYQSYRTSVDLWNELIKENSTKVGLMYNVVDIHNILTTANDFVYDIEPSEIGSEKIANAIYLSI